MNKCLVSKMNGVIKDDNMEILGVLKFTGAINTAKDYTNVVLSSTDGKSSSIQIKNGTVSSSSGIVCDDGGSYVLPSKRVEYTVNMKNDSTFLIKDKYKLTALNTGGMSPLFKTSALKYCTNLQTLSFGGNGAVGTLDDFTNLCVCTELNFANTSTITGDLTDFLDKLAANRNKLMLGDLIVHIIASTAFTNIPSGILTSYSSTSSYVKLTTASTTYPKGWFVSDKRGNPVS